MANLPEDIVTYLNTISAITTRGTNIAYNRVPASKSDPYIWFQQIGREADRCLGGEIGPEKYTYVLECTSEDLDTAKDLMDDCLTALDGYSGAMGTRTVAFSQADDLDDDYESRQRSGDSKNFHVAAMQLQIGLDSR